jgi:hypothetical protein
LNLKKFMATFCKSGEPVLHRETPCLKFFFKILKRVGEP